MVNLKVSNQQTQIPSKSLVACNKLMWTEGNLGDWKLCCSMASGYWYCFCISQYSENNCPQKCTPAPHCCAALYPRGFGTVVRLDHPGAEKELYARGSIQVLMRTRSRPPLHTETHNPIRRSFGDPFENSVEWVIRTSGPYAKQNDMTKIWHKVAIIHHCTLWRTVWWIMNHLGAQIWSPHVYGCKYLKSALAQNRCFIAKLHVCRRTNAKSAHI